MITVSIHDDKSEHPCVKLASASSVRVWGMSGRGRDVTRTLVGGRDGEKFAHIATQLQWHGLYTATTGDVYQRHTGAKNNKLHGRVV